VAAPRCWHKLGRVFVPEAHAVGRPWLHSHAANPVAVPLDDDVVRVYFSSRDDRSRSHVAWFEFALDAPHRVLRLAEAPLVVPGELGSFDDSGASLGCVLRHGERHLLYYVGWNLSVTVPWRNSIGLAVGDASGLAFKKHGRAPVLDRSDLDPFSLSYPWVLHDGTRFRMWYGSNLTWGATVDAMTHVIRSASSDDGLHWCVDDEIALALAGGDETCLARPCVVAAGAGYRMWYSRRGARYRIGYAEARDGRRWRRMDSAAGIDVGAATEWDGDMVCYPSVFAARGRRYMLYNGNGFGATGIGLAVASDFASVIPGREPEGAR
jgi:hypothetical protein